MKVGFVTTDWGAPDPDDEAGFPALGGSAYYRVGLPCAMMKEHGHDVFLGAHLGRDKKTDELGIANWQQEVQRDFDIIVLHRWMEEHAAENILRARAAGQIVLNDVDDHFDGISPANQAFRTTHPKYNPKANRNHYRRALAASSALTVSTPFFQQHYRNLKTVLLRNMIDLRLWPRETYLDGPPVVGWVGMTSHRSSDLQVIRGLLSEYLQNNFGRFHHSGYYPQAPKASELLGIPGDVICTTSPPVTIAHIPELYRDFNIGIVPLADVSFNHAKSNIKGLEYAASGIPFIASATPEYVHLNRLGVGITCGKPKEWRRAFKTLADPEVREKLAESSRDAVEMLSAEARWHEWPAAYETLLNGSGA